MYWISIRAPNQNFITIRYFHFIIKKVYGVLFAFQICHQKFLFTTMKALEGQRSLKSS